jgi:hypothetical protein
MKFSSLKTAYILPTIILTIGIIAEGCKKETPLPQEQNSPYEVRIAELRHINLTVEDGAMKGISYLQTFTEPNWQGTLLSPDFRSTKFNLSSVPLDFKERSGITLGVQLSKQEQITHDIDVDARSVTTFLVDDNLIVFPDNIRTVAKGGPYITLKFHRGSDISSPLAGWFAKVEQEEQRLEAKLGNDGTIVLGNVKKNTPIKCTIQDLESEKVINYMIYPGFLGATENLITYKVWNLAK